ncbi:NADP-dependent oxidoreductase [Lentzea alba]|uniref:NADP-dependent oxidoreductase n=1 Tax=Lentzea alba TaxID=2714351 RepID=UPI0039BF20AB
MHLGHIGRNPYPHAAENDVIVRVCAAGFTPGELDWPGTWTDRAGRDRAGRDRTPSVPGHELSGVVAELGYGTTGLTVGQRVFGLADWTRDGSLAEFTAVEARNLAPLPADIDHAVGAALPISGLTAWQALFDHTQLRSGQTVLIHGAAGGVGSIAVQLARRAGARVIGTGRASPPPYNEHLVRDCGFMNLGPTLFLVVAAIRPTPVLVRLSSAAVFLFGLPHMIFHAFHLDHLSPAAATTQTITTVVLTVLLPAAVFLMAGHTDLRARNT